MRIESLSARGIARIVLIAVLVVLALYVVYLVRQPLTWIFISVFLAVALSPLVEALNRHMKRGFAILIVYLGLFAVVIGMAALLIPPLVNEGTKLAGDVPGYANDVQRYAHRNGTLRKLERDYSITEKLKKEAGKLPAKVGSAAGTLQDVALVLVNRLFAVVTILVLTAFLLADGKRWVRKVIELQPEERRERLERLLGNMYVSTSGYVIGNLAISVIAGVTTYILLIILGVPFAAPLAVIVALLDLIPLVGATIGAVIVGLVTLFTDFPTATIIWVIWAIVYQQLENHLLQPQIYRRTVNVHPFIVIVAILIGAALLGVLGALIAIPLAASAQILIRDWWDYRQAAEKASGEQLALGER